MITYLKHVGNFKHANLKGRKFEDIQVLYEKIKRLNEHFISTGSAKDEGVASLEINRFLRKRQQHMSAQSYKQDKKHLAQSLKPPVALQDDGLQRCGRMERCHEYTTEHAAISYEESCNMNRYLITSLPVDPELELIKIAIKS
ncbi:hypothetical protein Tco_1503206 [Tanacetum coccineum]